MSDRERNMMTDYTSTEERLIFTERMRGVREDILRRLRPRNDREGTYIQPVSAGGRNPFADAFEAKPDAPYVICLADAIVRSWLDTPCLIYPGEALVGITRPFYPIMEHFSWGINFHEDVCDDPSYPDGQTERKRIDALRERMSPMTSSYMDECGRAKYGGERYGHICDEGMFWAGGYQGHTIPNYPTLLNTGLDGMLAKIDACETALASPEQSVSDFYEANRIIVRGMTAFLEKYTAHAETLAEGENDPIQRRYYREIAENCAFVAHRKPVTLYQALQLMWCLSLWDWVDCMGRVDQYLLPFWEYSKAHGDVITPEEGITSIMFKIWENGSHNSTLSGCKPEDGSDATNELSYLFLQVLRNIRDTHPRMVVRVGENCPQPLLELVVKLWSEGMSDPTIVSDTNVIPGLMKIEVPLRDARDYATLGCQEIEIPGKSNTGCEDGSFNVAKVFEIALRGGMATETPGFRIGPATKPFIECESYEELWESFREQLEFFTELHLWLCSRGQEIRAANHSKLVKGVFTDGVLESGRNHDDGGPLYNHGVVETAGIAAVADSLTAVKKLVYDERRVSRETLMAALEADFEGYEELRQMLLKAPKFGNNHDEADDTACRVLDLYWSECGKYRSVRGGLYTGACSLLTAGISYGSRTGALPDGRHAGEPLGNTMGPRPGADTRGVTSMLMSVAKLPLEKGVGGTTLNVLLPKSTMTSPELRTDIAGMMRAYMSNGGQMAQVTTADIGELLDAKKHPERHGNLIVRVGGYSHHFTQLSESVQNEIISRYASETAGG